ncbi:MAG: sugar dehydrogenase [Armatimonadetes bacterium]|nr:sugar dehydrogenase [Armatimonadota bacterium]
MNSPTVQKVSKSVVAERLSFPTSLCFDPDGNAWVAESGLPWDGAPIGGRVSRIHPNGVCEVIASDLRHPVNGLCWLDGALIVSEGGYPGRISRLTPEGERTTILDNLPGLGNYHTNMVAPGPDGKLYFSQGALTNLGVIGLDAYQLGWLGHLPHNCDVPGLDVTLVGQGFETPDPLSSVPDARTQTGAFSPFGSKHEPGARLSASLPCTAAIMRCNPDGSELELVAWGVRNAYGLGFLPDGRLIATDQGSDDRGSRPIGHAPELLFEIKEGAWYGWPDFVGGVPVTDPQFKPTRGADLEFVLANHDELPSPEAPLMRLPVNSAATKFDRIPSTDPSYPGQLLICLFGDEKPMTAPAGFRVGRNISRIDPNDWSLHPLPDLELSRPIDVRVNPVDGSICIVDFGEFEMVPRGVDARSGSGKVWRVEPDELFSST